MSDAPRAENSIYNRTTSAVPKEGDVLIVMRCCDAGPRLVLARRADGYKCGACRRSPEQGASVTLGPGGALPAGWTP